MPGLTPFTLGSIFASLLTISENEVTKRLAGYGALVAVPTMVAGIYGMNFDNMPELHADNGYYVVIGSMAVICSVLYFKFKRSNWL